MDLKRRHRGIIAAVTVREAQQHSVMPTAHTSLSASYGCPSTTSGAM